MRNRTILAAAAMFSLAVAFNAMLRGQAPAGQTQAQPQAAAPTGPPGSVAGQIVSATTGEPLRKATLSLRPQGRGGTATSTTSDNAGMFRFNTVDPGTYTLIGDRTGYVRASYGEDTTGQARQIVVSSNQTAAAIQMRLQPHSVIAGKVFDQDGDPVENANVQIWYYSYPRGQRQLTNYDQTTTNDLGEYRLSGLAPGRYYISAAPRNAPGQGGGRGRGRGGEPATESYVNTYYPRAMDASNAAPIDLVPGSEMRGVDVGLLRSRLYTVSGSIEGLPASFGQPAQPAGDDQGKGKQKGRGGPGGPGGGLNVSLVPRNGVQQGWGGGGNAGAANGTFEFRSVQPGSYYLMAQTRGQQPADRLSARMPVEIGSGDITGLRVRLAPPLQVTGAVVPETDDATLNLKNVRVNFTSAFPAAGGQGGGPGGGAPRIDLDANGKFATTLDPDVYNVEIAGAPAGYYLRSVKLAGQNTPDARVDLSVSGAQLSLVMANDSADITGTVTKLNGDPVQSARVTAVPANNSVRRDLYKSVTSGADGTFTLSGMPPGAYKVFAWEEVEANAWMDQDFRRPFENFGSAATVKDGAGPMLTLRVIGREQLRIAGVQ